MSPKKNKGKWTKEGRTSTNPDFPGSYGNYTYTRATPGKIKDTPQKALITKIGKAVGETCKGKSDDEFLACRKVVISQVLKQYEADKAKAAKAKATKTVVPPKK